MVGRDNGKEIGKCWSRLTSPRFASAGIGFVIQAGATQEQARLPPVPVHGALGHRTHLGNFSEREATEKVEIDQFRERSVQHSEAVEGVDVSMPVMWNSPPRFCARRLRA